MKPNTARTSASKKSRVSVDSTPERIAKKRPASDADVAGSDTVDAPEVVPTPPVCTPEVVSPATPERPSEANAVADDAPSEGIEPHAADEEGRPKVIYIELDPHESKRILAEGAINPYKRLPVAERRFSVLRDAGRYKPNTIRTYSYYYGLYYDYFMHVQSWWKEKNRDEVGDYLRAHCTPGWLDESLTAAKKMTRDEKSRHAAIARAVTEVDGASSKTSPMVAAWERGPLVTEERAFHFIRYLADYVLDGKKSSLEPALSAVGLFGSWQAILFGLDKAPVVSKAPCIRAVLKSNMHTYINQHSRGKKANVTYSAYSKPDIDDADDQKGSIADGYTPEEWDKYINVLMEMSEALSQKLSQAPNPRALLTTKKDIHELLQACAISWFLLSVIMFLRVFNALRHAFVHMNVFMFHFVTAKMPSNMIRQLNSVCSCGYLCFHVCFST